MPSDNPGFDWICKKGQRIQHKAACLIDGKWSFNIDYNRDTDYYILSLWKDRESLEPMHILLIHKDDMVWKGTRRGGHILEKMWNRKTLNIYNDLKSSMSFKYFYKYELIEKLAKLKEIIIRDKEENKI